MLVMGGVFVLETLSVIAQVIAAGRGSSGLRGSTTGGGAGIPWNG